MHWVCFRKVLLHYLVQVLNWPGSILLIKQHKRVVEHLLVPLLFGLRGALNLEKLTGSALG